MPEGDICEKHQTLHTAGPWNVYVTPGNTLYIQGAKGKHIAVVQRDKKSAEEVAANASILAAALELLAACKSVVQDRECIKDGRCLETPCAYCRCQEAIAKAQPKA